MKGTPGQADTASRDLKFVLLGPNAGVPVLVPSFASCLASHKVINVFS